MLYGAIWADVPILAASTAMFRILHGPDLLQRVRVDSVSSLLAREDTV